MDAYVYKADLYCKDCIKRIKVGLLTPVLDISNESTYDSDDYPKGPYPDGGGESDSPAHCAECHIHLENPLTSDGEDYVREQVFLKKNKVTKEWKEYYSYLFN
jgi:hypothetical protein